MNSSASGEARERLLLIEPDSKQRRSLERILRAVVGTVDVQDRLTVIPNIDAYDLLVVGCDTLEATEREQLLERFGGVHSKLLFVSAKWTRDQLVDLFKSQRLTNLVSRTGVGEIDPSDLIATIRAVNKGETYITPQFAARLLQKMQRRTAEKPVHRPEVELTHREEQILNEVSSGLTNKEIARKLTLSEKTVKHYMTSVLQKLQARNRVEAVIAHMKHDKPVGPR